MEMFANDIHATKWALEARVKTWLGVESKVELTKKKKKIFKKCIS